MKTSPFSKLKKGEITQKTAAKLARLTSRHIRNKIKRYTKEGAVGIAHKNRGEANPKRTPEATICWRIGTIRRLRPHLVRAAGAQKYFAIIYKRCNQHYLMDLLGQNPMNKCFCPLLAQVLIFLKTLKNGVHSLKILFFK